MQSTLSFLVLPEELVASLFEFLEWHELLCVLPLVSKKCA